MLILFSRLTTSIRAELQNTICCHRQLWLSHTLVNAVFLIKHSVSEEERGLLFSLIVSTEVMETTRMHPKIQYQFSLKDSKNFSILCCLKSNNVCTVLDEWKKRDKRLSRYTYLSLPVQFSSKQRKDLEHSIL